ncbi:MAG: M2 family metallopeptidase [Deltaproteobacteria bacterium]|nr:M2 family metallopeptidase [Deltaproteobacteria bacterium]
MRPSVHLLPGQLAVRFSLLALILSAAPGCEGDPTAGPTGPIVTKLEARGMDAALWETDYCASGDWYGDGACDAFCPQTDDDCDSALQSEVDLFTTQYEAEYAPLLKVQALASWETSTTNSPEAYQDYNNAMLKVFMFSLNKERQDSITAFLLEKSKLNLFSRRTLEVMAQDSLVRDLSITELGKLLSIVKLQGEARSLFSSFTPELDGEKVSTSALGSMLRAEADPARRQKIWEASRQIGAEIAPKVIEAVTLANEVAVAVGYKNAWEYYLNTLQDQKPEDLVAIFDEVGALLEKPYEAMKAQYDDEVAARYQIEPNTLMIWHYDDPFFQIVYPRGEADLSPFYQDKTKEGVVELAAHFFDTLGLNVSDVLGRSDLYPRDGKRLNAFMLDIDREGDLRVLMSAWPGHGAMSTAVHELGHAADFKYLDASLPFMLRTATHTLTTEAMAMFFEDQTLTPEFLVDVVGADESETKAIEGPLLEHRRREGLVFARWSLVMFYFEKALYEDPQQDLNAVWWDLVERYQGIKRPPGRDLPDWACKSHITTSPMYFHNYLLGKLYGAQLRAVLAKAVGHEGSPFELSILRAKESTSFIKEKVLRVGRELHWWELVEHTTGEPLGARAFVDELVGAETSP